MADEQRVWFRYSKTKLQLMHRFFSDEAFQLLKTSLKNIESTATGSGQNRSTDINDLFPITDNKQHPFSVVYLRYLSRYSNSTLTFNEPVKIDVEASDLLFEHLYREFIFEEPEQVSKTSVIETVKTKLYPAITKYVNLDYCIETGKIPGLIMPVELDFIGKNDRPVVGKITDFNLPCYNLDASLSNLFVLMKTFELNNEIGNYFIIGDEPSMQNNKQHNTWKQVQASKFLKFVPSNETDRISEYMEKHSVQPYFEVEEA
jgi:hypothetical protein